jgi:putative chitobiose transport system permease protein
MKSASTLQNRIPRWSDSRIKPIPTAIAVFLACVFILPAVWIVVGSLRSDAETFSSLFPLSWNTLIPTSISLQNYVDLFAGQFGQSIFISSTVCLLSVFFGLAVIVPAGYALGVLNFTGRTAVFACIVVGFMVPFEAVAIPLAQQFDTWHISNSLFSLILPGIGNGLAVFNMRQFYRGVPASLREAATLDGASEPRILWSVYFPISGSALVNSALLIFLSQWTAYLWPILVVSDPALNMAPVALASTFSDNQANFGQNFAGTVLLALVPAALMFILQKSFGGLSMASGEK